MAKQKRPDPPIKAVAPVINYGCELVVLYEAVYRSNGSLCYEAETILDHRPQTTGKDAYKYHMVWVHQVAKQHNIPHILSGPPCSTEPLPLELQPKPELAKRLEKIERWQKHVYTSGRTNFDKALDRFMQGQLRTETECQLWRHRFTFTSDHLKLWYYNGKSNLWLLRRQDGRIYLNPDIQLYTISSKLENAIMSRYLRHLAQLGIVGEYP